MVNLTQATGQTQSPKDITNAVLTARLEVPANISSPTAKKLIRESDTHTETSGNGYKRTYSYREWRKQVVEAMLLDGMSEKEARAFDSCAEYPKQFRESTKSLPANAETVWVCSGDMTHDAAVFCGTCDNRGCPDCAARQSARFIARFLPKAIELHLKGGRNRLRHIVLTTPIALTSDTADKVRKIVRKYAKLPRKALELVEAMGVELGKSWRTLGAIQSVEFGTDGEKLHFHIVHYGDYIPQDKLSDAWKEVTGGESYVVYVGAFKNGVEDVKSGVIEALKYATKFHKTDPETGEVDYLPPNVMPHLMRVLKGMRRVRSWGVFYGLPKVETEDFCCPECNATMFRLGVPEYQAWQEMTESARRSLLKSKLANKSVFGRNAGNKSPPKNRSGDKKMTDKDVFSDEYQSLETLGTLARNLKKEIADLQALRRTYGSEHESYLDWTKRQNIAKRRRKDVLAEISNRQLSLWDMEQ